MKFDSHEITVCLSTTDLLRACVRGDAISILSYQPRFEFLPPPLAHRRATRRLADSRRVGCRPLRLLDLTSFVLLSTRSFGSPA